MRRKSVRLPTLATEYPGQFSRRGEFRMRGNFTAFVTIAPATRGLLETARRRFFLKEVPDSALQEMISLQKDGFIGLLSLTSPNIFASLRPRATHGLFHSLVYEGGWTHEMWEGSDLTEGMRIIG